MRSIIINIPVNNNDNNNHNYNNKPNEYKCINEWRNRQDKTRHTSLNNRTQAFLKSYEELRLSLDTMSSPITTEVTRCEMALAPLRENTQGGASATHLNDRYRKGIHVLRLMNRIHN
jgi:hypothetical protein